MATFVGIRTRIAAIVLDMPATLSAEVPNLVNDGLKFAMREHNFWCMKAEASFTTTAASATLGAMPADFKEFRTRPYYTTYDGTVKDVNMSKDYVDANVYVGISTSDVGYPQLISPSIDEASLLVRPLPDGASDYTDGEYRVTVPYWKYLDELSADSDTNWFTDKGEQFLINYAAAEAFARDWDEDRSKVWAMRRDASWTSLLKLDKIKSLSGDMTLVPHNGARRPHIMQ